MAAGAVEPGLSRGTDRELYLIAISVHLTGTQNLFHRHVRAAYPAQGVLNPLPLGLQLLLIGNMPEVAAAAGGVAGAVRLPPGGGTFQNVLHPGVSYVFLHLQNAYGADLAPHGVVDKDHLPVNPSHAQPLGGVAGDGHGMELVLL